MWKRNVRSKSAGKGSPWPGYSCLHYRLHFILLYNSAAVNQFCKVQKNMAPSWIRQTIPGIGAQLNPRLWQIWACCTQVALCTTRTPHCSLARSPSEGKFHAFTLSFFRQTWCDVWWHFLFWVVFFLLDKWLMAIWCHDSWGKQYNTDSATCMFTTDIFISEWAEAHVTSCLKIWFDDLLHNKPSPSFLFIVDLIKSGLKKQAQCHDMLIIIIF